MNEKQFYICLIAFLNSDGGVAYKFMAAPIALSEEEAKQMAISDAKVECPEYAHLPIEISAYSFRRSALERAAREILGWEPPI